MAFSFRLGKWFGTEKTTGGIASFWLFSTDGQ
jgi:hypothetical protein